MIFGKWYRETRQAKREGEHKERIREGGMKERWRETEKETESGSRPEKRDGEETVRGMGHPGKDEVMIRNVRGHKGTKER